MCGELTGTLGGFMPTHDCVCVSCLFFKFTIRFLVSKAVATYIGSNTFKWNCNCEFKAKEEIMIKMVSCSHYSLG